MEILAKNYGLCFVISALSFRNYGLNLLFTEMKAKSNGFPRNGSNDSVLKCEAILK